MSIGQTIDAMYIGYNSDVLPQNNITDYLTRGAAAIASRSRCTGSGSHRRPEFRATRLAGSEKLAAYGLTATDVSAALAKNDYVSGLGNTKGQMVQVSLTASTGLKSLEEFRNLIVKQQNGAIIRLSDLGTVSLGG